MMIQSNQFMMCDIDLDLDLFFYYFVYLQSFQNKKWRQFFVCAGLYVWLYSKRRWIQEQRYKAIIMSDV